MSSRDERVREMWPTHTIMQIAAAVGTSGSSVSRLAVKLGLRGKTLLAEEQERPTAEEIEERSAEVRAGWTKSEEARRRVGWSSEAYTVPCLTSRQMFPTFPGQQGRSWIK